MCATYSPRSSPRMHRDGKGEALDLCRELLDPGAHDSVPFAGDRPPEVLASDPPARHFELCPAAVLEIHLSTEKINAATPRESPQRFLDGAGGRDLQQATVPDLILVEQVVQG